MLRAVSPIWSLLLGNSNMEGSQEPKLQKENSKKERGRGGQAGTEKDSLGPRQLPLSPFSMRVEV